MNLKLIDSTFVVIGLCKIANQTHERNMLMEAECLRCAVLY